MQQTFSTGQLSAFIIQLVTWQVLTRSEWKVQGRTQVKYLIGRSFSLHLASWNSEVYFLEFFIKMEKMQKEIKTLLLIFFIEMQYI